MKTLVEHITATVNSMDPIQRATSKHWVLIYKTPATGEFVAYETSDPVRFATDFVARRNPDAQFVGVLPMPARKAAEEFVSTFKHFMPLCATLIAGVQETAVPSVPGASRAYPIPTKS
jgi:hypothetical protein